MRRELRNDLEVPLPLVDAADSDRFARRLLAERDRLAGAIERELSAALRRRVSVEDVLQETILRAARARHSFRDDGRDSLYKWLLTIARNFIRDTAARRS